MMASAPSQSTANILKFCLHVLKPVKGHADQACLFYEFIVQKFDFSIHSKNILKNLKLNPFQHLDALKAA